MSMTETQDLITKIVAQDEPANAEDVKEFSVDLVANVSFIDILVNIAGNSTAINADKALSNIYIEPNSRLAAVNISGEEAAQIMKAKYPGKHNLLSDTTKRLEIYRFDFTDYMQKMKLSLPASAKSLNIKLTFGTTAEIGTFTGIAFTIRVVQDKAIESRGYRRYFTQDVTVTALQNKFQEVALPRTGLLDSFFLLPDALIKDIWVEKDDEKFPLKSYAELEKAVAGLHNDEEFDGNYIYCDLARPILAEKTRTLKLKFKNDTATTLKIIYEYVHFD